MTDTAANYDAAIHALRQRALMRGEVLPHNNERIDLLLMAAEARKSPREEKRT